MRTGTYNWRGAPVVALGALVALTGCEEDADPVTQLLAGIEVDPPDSIDFGTVQVGRSDERLVYVKNTGDRAITITPEWGERYDPAFALDFEGTTINPEGVGVLTVTFSPDRAESVRAVLVIQHDVPDVPEFEVDITGTGVTSTIEISPKVIDFGRVVVESTKIEVVTVSNLSEVPGEVEFIRGSEVKPCPGTNEPGVFCVRFRDGRSFNSENRFRLAQMETAQLEVQYRPVVPGRPSTGDFTLKTCETAACEERISLSGESVESGLRCMPDNLDFDQVNPNSSATQTVTCENIANNPITIVTWSISADSDPVFSTERPRTLVLDEGDDVSIDVSFRPTGLGTLNGNLLIETEDQTVEIALTGTGGGPDIQVLPPQLNFGQVSLIAPSRRSLVVTNTGFSTLRITDVQVDTMETGSFRTSDPRQYVIEPQQSETISIEFEPRVEGEIISGVRFISNDTDEGELEVILRGEGRNLPPCDFEVVPAQLNFGTVTVTRELRRAFEIRNRADPSQIDNICLITSVRMLQGSDPSFSLPNGDVLSQEIPPGASEVVEVDFSPTAQGTFTGQVEFSISSPTNPFNTVSLTGVGADSQLLIVPNELDFGTIGVGCASRDRAITIYNTGQTPVQIDSINLAAQANVAFSLANLPTGLPQNPVTLNAGQSVTFDVGFRADLRSAYASAVEIGTTEASAQRTYIVSLRGRGDVDATQIDEFEQLGKPKVDILFVIDSSCSMGDEQTALASNFQAFIQFAEAQGLDYHLGVTTADTTRHSGRLCGGRNCNLTGLSQNRIVTPRTTPSPAAVFGENAAVGTGSPGSAADESGLRAAEQALTPPNTFGHNAGFVRSDAVLSLIFISDEPDQSPGNVDYYINFFLSIKGFRNTNLFSASAITAPVAPGATSGNCSGPGGNASATGRYIAVAERTGGVFQSICTADWSRSLEDLSTTAFGFKSRFFLTNQPVVTTLKVFIDGVELPAQTMGGTINWTYDFSTNSVNFAPYATPEPGSQIRVEYSAECL